MSRTLVIRFGALGDLCLLSWSLAKLAANAQPGATSQVTLVTKADFVDLTARFPGVSEVVPLPGPRFRDLVSLAGRLRSEKYDTIIDAHNSLRSNLLLSLLARRPQRRLAKDTVSRLGLLFLRRRPEKLARTMRNRFDDLMAPLHAGGESAVATADRNGEPSPPLSHLKSSDSSDRPALGIAPGARWDTKRWPASHYAVFLQTFRQLSSAPVHLFLGPREEAWFADSILARTADRISDIKVWRSPDLVALATGLAGCSTLLTNDSGLMHVAETVGTPVLALFGPTVEEFGYFPSLPSSHVVQKDLDCRPCSRNGKRACWRQDQACLAEISPARIQECLATMRPWSDLIWPEG